MMLSEETSAVRPQKQTRFNGAKLVWMLKGSPLTVTGAVIIVLMLLMMIFSPWLATHDPNAIDLTARLLPPSAAHWFGTDEVGRDLFSRVLVGSQQSILAGLVVVAIAGMIGSLLGCLSGVLGGRADAIIMRIMDIMLSIPSLVLTMALAAALGPSLFNAMLGDCYSANSVLCAPGAGASISCTPVYLCSGGENLWRVALASDQLAYFT